jgi:hypothetical protein
MCLPRVKKYIRQFFFSLTFFLFFFDFLGVWCGLGLWGLVEFWCFEVFWGTGGLTRATPGPSTCLYNMYLERSSGHEDKKQR